jgi:transposase
LPQVSPSTVERALTGSPGKKEDIGRLPQVDDLYWFKRRRRRPMDILNVGLDVGYPTCHMVGMDKEGNVSEDRKVSTDAASLRTEFKKLNGEVHVHLETCEMARWVRGVLKPVVKRVVVGHAKSNYWIGRDPIKNDRIDARKLADLLRMGKVHEAYFTDDVDRANLRETVKQLDDLTRQQAKMKQKIKSRFRQHGLVPTGERVFSRDGREEWLSRLPSEDVRDPLRLVYALFDHATNTVAETARLMARRAARFPEVELLDSIPGVGILSACRFVAYVQDVNRFSSKRALWRYAGLGVTDRDSCGKEVSFRRLDRWSASPRLKEMSRKVFLGALRCVKENVFQRDYNRIVDHTKNKTHARLAVQRKILAVLRAVWKGGVPYKDDSGKVR